jgi:hypothetical protein
MTERRTQRGQRPGSMHIDHRARQVLDYIEASGLSDDTVVDRKKAAELLGVSVAQLDKLSHLGTGLAVVDYSQRCKNYSIRELKRFVHLREVIGSANKLFADKVLACSPQAWAGHIKQIWDKVPEVVRTGALAVFLSGVAPETRKRALAQVVAAQLSVQARAQSKQTKSKAVKKKDSR